jgi:hypothetical protein
MAFRPRRTGERHDQGEHSHVELDCSYLRFRCRSAHAVLQPSSAVPPAPEGLPRGAHLPGISLELALDPGEAVHFINLQRGARYVLAGLDYDDHVVIPSMWPCSSSSASGCSAAVPPLLECSASWSLWPLYSLDIRTQDPRPKTPNKFQVSREKMILPKAMQGQKLGVSRFSTPHLGIRWPFQRQN